MSVVGVLNGDDANNNDDAIVWCIADYCSAVAVDVVVAAAAAAVASATAVLVTLNEIFGEL